MRERAAVALLAVLVLGACGAQEPTSPPLESYQGQFLTQAVGASQEGALWRFVDVSVSVGGDKATYGTKGQEDNGQWTVLTICADASTIPDAETIEVAIVPNDLATAQVVGKARAGELADLLYCDGLSHGAGTGDLPRPLPATS